MGRLVPRGVELPESLLHQEVEPLPHRLPGLPEKGVHRGQVRIEAVALLGDVETVHEDGRLLVEPGRIDSRGPGNRLDPLAEPRLGQFPVLCGKFPDPGRKRPDSPCGFPEEPFQPLSFLEPRLREHRQRVPHRGFRFGPQELGGVFPPGGDLEQLRHGEQIAQRHFAADAELRADPFRLAEERPQQLAVHRQLRSEPAGLLHVQMDIDLSSPQGFADHPAHARLPGLVSSRTANVDIEEPVVHGTGFHGDGDVLPVAFRAAVACHAHPGHEGDVSTNGDLPGQGPIPPSSRIPAVSPAAKPVFHRRRSRGRSTAAGGIPRSGTPGSGPRTRRPAGRPGG